MANRDRDRDGEGTDRPGDLLRIEGSGRASATAHHQDQAPILPPTVQRIGCIEAFHHLRDRPLSVKWAGKAVDMQEASSFEGGQRPGDIFPALARGMQDADPLEMSWLRQATLCVEQTGSRQSVQALSTL